MTRETETQSDWDRENVIQPGIKSDKQEYNQTKPKIP